MRKSACNLRIISLIFTLIVICACNQSGPAGAPAKPTSAAVTVVTLQYSSLTLNRELPGRVTPFIEAEVRPQVTGIIKEQKVNEGGVVQAGQVLYQLDDARYRADYNSAKAMLARANAALEVSRLSAERSAKLVETGTVSKQDNENAIARLRQAQADVGVAEAEVASNAVILDFARITAPISGRIGKSAVNQGALVTSNQMEPLATIQQIDPVYVDLNQSASELMEIRKQLEAGTLSNTDDIPVSILLEDNSAYQHTGKLKFSEVTVDPTTGSFMLRIEVPNPENVLLPGMYVRAELSSGKREQAVLVPQQGISRDPKGNAIALVVGKDNKAELRPVQISRAIGDQWLVESGLAAGDKVIVEGLQKVQPGMDLQVTELADDQPAATSNQPVR